MNYLKLVLFLSLGLLWVTNISVSAQTEYVTAFAFADFKGTPFVIKENWKGSDLWDRKIKSIRVPAGYRVRMYEDRNFKGAETMISENWNPGDGAHWTTRIRSIRLERAEIQPPRPEPVKPTKPDSFPVLYAGTNFDGPAEAIEIDKSKLSDWDGSPHTIRSVRVPQGWYLVLYTKSRFRGKSYNLNSNITFAPGDEWYNKIRSIKVYKGTPPKQPR